jgi:hypothetical protein
LVITSYDANLNILDETHYTPDGSVHQRETRSYDERGNLTEQVYDSPSSHSRCVSVYDANGKFIELACFTGNGSLDHKSVSTRDALGRAIELNSYEGDGRFPTRIVYTYCDAGEEPCEITSYNADGSLQYQMCITEDPNRRVGESMTLNGDGSIERDTYAYNSRRDLTELIEYNADGYIQARWVWIYDADGIIWEKAGYAADGSVIERTDYSYVFDSVGNWTERTTSEWVTKEGQLSLERTQVDRRIITYH